MSVKVRFMTLSGVFCTAKEETFSDSTTAMFAVCKYAADNGFKNVKLVDDKEAPGVWRYTAITPNGRGGRNIAFAEDDYDPTL